jgi:hypothetical protein
MIDPEAIRTDLAIAFVKRARKYCDEALLADALGSAESVKGVEEGDIYTRIILPDMDELLAEQGFVGSDYLETWATYRVAVLTDDAAMATAASEQLVEWNCAMQAALGIATCTDSVDEL